MNASLLLMKNTAKLEKMIRTNESYDKILKQSQKVDVLISKRFIEINSKTTK